MDVAKTSRTNQGTDGRTRVVGKGRRIHVLGIFFNFFEFWIVIYFKIAKLLLRIPQILFSYHFKICACVPLCSVATHGPETGRISERMKFWMMSHCSKTCVCTLFVEIYIFSFLFYLFVVFNVFVPCSHPPLLCPHLPKILIFLIILNCFPHQITALGQHAKSNISTLQKPSIQMFETMSTRLEMEKCSKSQQHQRVNQREFQTMATRTL